MNPELIAQTVATYVDNFDAGDIVYDITDYSRHITVDICIERSPIFFVVHILKEAKVVRTMIDQAHQFKTYKSKRPGSSCARTIPGPTFTDLDELLKYIRLQISALVFDIKEYPEPEFHIPLFQNVQSRNRYAFISMAATQSKLHRCGRVYVARDGILDPHPIWLSVDLLVWENSSFLPRNGINSVELQSSGVIPEILQAVTHKLPLLFT